MRDLRKTKGQFLVNCSTSDEKGQTTGQRGSRNKRTAGRCPRATRGKGPTLHLRGGSQRTQIATFQDRAQWAGKGQGGGASKNKSLWVLIRTQKPRRRHLKAKIKMGAVEGAQKNRSQAAFLKRTEEKKKRGAEKNSRTKEEVACWCAACPSDKQGGRSTSNRAREFHLVE